MNIAEITNKLLERYDLRIICGKMGENDPAPILPFIIMDCALTEFHEGLAPLETHRETKRFMGLWRAEYRTFNHRLFACLNQEQTDFVIDLMDAYESFIGNEVMLIRLAVMDLVKGCEFGDQKIVASCMLCNVFAQVAQITWGAVYKTPRHHEQVCPELEKLRNYSHKLTNAIVLIPEDINPNASERLHGAIQVYMNKTVKWLKGYGKM